MTDSAPSPSPRSGIEASLTHDVIVYHRAACCLCDRAVELLNSRGLVPKLVDVDQQPELCEAHGHCVPVVSIDGKIRFRGRVSPLLLDRLLAYDR